MNKREKKTGKKTRVTPIGFAMPFSGSSSLLQEEFSSGAGEEQAALQRDMEPDDFDFGTDVQGDRVRGAGGQSLAELVIAREKGWGLDEHGGGIRHDLPEPNVNDLDPEATTLLLEEEADEKSRIA